MTTHCQAASHKQACIEVYQSLWLISGNVLSQISPDLLEGLGITVFLELQLDK